MRWQSSLKGGGLWNGRLAVEFKTSMDLLLSAGGIALLGLALYLSHMADKGGDH
jgi:hypothetical protein